MLTVVPHAQHMRDFSFFSSAYFIVNFNIYTILLCELVIFEGSFFVNVELLKPIDLVKLPFVCSVLNKFFGKVGK